MKNKPACPNGESVSKSPLRILHLEDNPLDRELLALTLATDGLDCEFVHADRQKEFEAALGRRSSFDLIISDFTLPTYDGMAALAAARKMKPETPFIFVSGTIGEERAVESLKSGATDYVLKNHLVRLGAVIRRAIRDAQERVERKELETQLRQAQKMEAIGQLAGGVAHDFNNLLSVIRGNTDLVLCRDQQLSEESRECLKQVTAASARAASLTRQLLVFGRKQIMQTRPLSLNDAVSNLAKMLKRVISANIQLECISDASLPFVQADIGMIEQVLLNLVLNARDAMPHGGQLLITTEPGVVDEAQARMHPEARVGDFACLTVSDTGTGIAPEHLPHIFEPFFTTKEPGLGTGLGLASVYSIVKQHQGWVEVSTRLNAGTAFKIFLPAIPQPDSVTVPGRADAAPPGGSERILLVEDNHAVRQMTRRILESFGYQVLEVASGKEALEVWPANSEEIDLLLTDIVMPDGVTGRELAERLRKHRPTLKVVLVSGYDPDVAGSGTDFIGHSNGFFLQKPYASRVLLDTVRRCLDENGREVGRASLNSTITWQVD